VAGLSGRQISVDHANGFPVPITSHSQSTGGLQAASGTRRNKNRPSFQYRFSSILHRLGSASAHEPGFRQGLPEGSFRPGHNGDVS